MYMIVLLSYERFHAVNQGKQLTFKRTMILMSFVIIFTIVYSLPTFRHFEVVNEDGIDKLKLTELSCNQTFSTVYIGAFNAFFRLIFPTICLVGFNISIYKKVILIAK